MIRGILKTGGLALAASAALIGLAHAGGFSRGTADTDILYEDGEFNMRMGALYVSPNRGYETINGAAATDADYLDDYTVPSAALKLNLTDSARCAGTFTQPFGAGATYGTQAIAAGITAAALDGNPAPSGTAYTNFVTNEVGLTCGYKFNVGPGRLWILGGAFLEDIAYEEGARVAHPTLGPLGVLDLREEFKPGYRLGAAYDIPDIALRIQAMYRSEMQHNLNGTFALGGAVLNPAAVGSATLPQSFEIKAQSGVAPGWLVFGSVKWTDWSVFDVLNYTTTTAQTKEFFYKDGWTYSLGVGHKFNDMISGSLSLTYDQGVSTTEDVNRDTITVASGIQIDTGNGGKLSFGGAVSRLQGGSVAQAATCNGVGGDCGNGAGNKFSYTIGDDWVYSVGANFSLKF